MIAKLAAIREKWFLKNHLRDQFTSVRLRDFFYRRYGIKIGLYSYGCFDQTRIPRGTEIGRYCSFANTAHIFNGNHGLEYISLHPYLYNVNLGMVAEETIRRGRCVIEDDVWMGHQSIVLPSVTRIGRGAVIGAGAVVTRDVPPYAIVAGNPARIIKFRFELEIIESIERSRWWELSAMDLKALIDSNPAMIYSPSKFYAAHRSLEMPELADFDGS